MSIIKNKTRYFISDFIDIQRKSFFTLLERGLIEEFTKRNPITNSKKTLEIFFYPEYYKLTLPEITPRNAILKEKSYTSKVYIPVQLTNKITKTIKLKWVCLGDLPLMTKRGHFILNGSPRIVVNQILRSPGIYYQQKIFENFKTKWDYKPSTTYKRYYADIICQRGTWLRLEIDKEKALWAQMKKGPKIPLLWFLVGMGLTEKMIFNTIHEPKRLLENIEKIDPNKQKQDIYPYVKNPPEAWREIYSLITTRTPFRFITEKNDKNLSDLDKKNKRKVANPVKSVNVKRSRSKEAVQTTYVAPQDQKVFFAEHRPNLQKADDASKQSFPKAEHSRTAVRLGQTSEIGHDTKKSRKGMLETSALTSLKQKNSLLGRKWLFNKFMNPRTYDLGKIGRKNLNKKLGISISPKNFTLTPQDLVYATDYLLKVENGLKKLDDIDHLQNRRVRTSGELLQLQIGTGLIRLEKEIRQKLNEYSINPKPFKFSGSRKSPKNASFKQTAVIKIKNKQPTLVHETIHNLNKIWKEDENLSLDQLINTKAWNSSLREFFGSSPLSQFMDQINPLSELTHKRRLTSMGPGGVSRDSATLAIRGIHPTHYGRICPVETPEGKNTGLVNSMTTLARVNADGFLQSPFYLVFKGQVQTNLGTFYFSADQEEKLKIAAPDVTMSYGNFLPKEEIPVKLAEDFTKLNRNRIQYVGISPLQMISIATSLIPFLEHDDANRALMGSNMQRQAVPLVRPEKPIVGTGLEGRAVSDSGHALQAKQSGFVTYVSGRKIILTSTELFS